MSYRQRQLGVIPSPQDYRDYKLNRVTAVKRAFPEEYTFPYLVPAPYDQNVIYGFILPPPPPLMKLTSFV